MSGHLITRISYHPKKGIGPEQAKGKQKAPPPINNNFIVVDQQWFWAACKTGNRIVVAALTPLLSASARGGRREGRLPYT